MEKFGRAIVGAQGDGLLLYLYLVCDMISGDMNILELAPVFCIRKVSPLDAACNLIVMDLKNGHDPFEAPSCSEVLTHEYPPFLGNLIFLQCTLFSICPLWE